MSMNNMIFYSGYRDKGQAEEIRSFFSSEIEFVKFFAISLSVSGFTFRRKKYLTIIQEIFIKFKIFILIEPKSKSKEKFPYIPLEKNIYNTEL